MVDRDGVRIAYEDFGGRGPRSSSRRSTDRHVARVEGPGALPGTPRPGRHHRPAGNGRSRPSPEPTAYADVEFVGRHVAVMDAAGIEQAPLVGFCTSVWWALTAAPHPERVSAIVAVAPPRRSSPRDTPSAATTSRFGAGHRGGLGEGQPALLAQGTSGDSWSSSSARCSPSPTRRSRSRTASAGGCRSPATLTRRRVGLGVVGATRPGDAGWPASVPGARGPRRRRPVPAAAIGRASSPS